MNYDLLLKNGTVITVDKHMTVCHWVGIKDGTIAGLGNAEPEGETASRVIDLAGRTVLPGLMDCHVHVMPAGLSLSAVPLEDARTVAEVLERIEAACASAPDAQAWIFAMNYVTQNVSEQRYPTRFELDAVSHGKKVMVLAATLHGCAVNTSAMEVCAVPGDMPGVERDGGDITGVYSSDESSFLACANALGDLPDEALWQYIMDCADNAASKGVTTMHGLFGMFVKDDRDMALITSRASALPIEMVVFYQTWDVDKAQGMGLPRVGGCLTLDGASFEYTMANFAPYKSAPALRGVLYHNDEEVYQVVRKAHENDMQCTLHALGDRAIDQLIWTYHRVFMEQGRKDLRHRIEHFSYPTDEQIAMAADLGLVLSIQPGFTYYWDRAKGGEFEYMFGREGADRWDPFHKLVEAGCIVCAGSDCPVTAVDPLADIAAVVNGPNPIRNAPLDDAIRMVTINAAYAAGLEGRKGSIELGKDADLVVLDRNPYDCADDPSIHEMQVLRTIRAGEIIFEATD
ncbi:MAG: amidohydrolase family protein [Clostridiales Family XIII bacterium]|jgi:predicted amidohydrolase YtcJ|nr:amidohydrolase family protein [Clostridiales Family XIII bacterium]